jgi:ABC-type bacteriocin/lantibiotic exporter with double-glycine peptidase domain
MTSLDVPLIFQEDDHSCTPVCMKMVLEFVRRKFTQGIPDLDVPEVADAVRASADDGGTTFENIELINELLLDAKPSLEFVAGSGHSFDEIKEELGEPNRLPVIAWITVPSPQGSFNHSIVITDIDEEKLIICLNDPVYGKETMSIREFMQMWEQSFRILIRIRIGERKQRLMKEYLKEAEGSGGSES